VDWIQLATMLSFVGGPEISVS